MVRGSPAGAHWTPRVPTRSLQGMTATSDPTATAWMASVRALILRDLDTLDRQVAAYPDDAAIWALPAALPNSTGTLVLHLCGNLRHFVGAVLGHTGYVRQRELEFSARDVDRATLRAAIVEARRDVEHSFAQIDAAQAVAPYPLEILKGTVASGDWITHLATHLAYHLGQVDFHRRIVTSQREGVDAIKSTAVASWRKLP
jgi:hypothetical protein